MGAGLANWNLYLHQGYAGGEIIASAITNEYGYYSFWGIPDGDYVIELVLPYGLGGRQPHQAGHVL
jgi:protocatechuate 3,4-dioxygenase beta subunit